MPRIFTLGKKERLKSRKLIEKIFNEGKSFVVGSIRVSFILDNGSPNKEEDKSALQFGAGVSSKNFKKAVDRNRVKRLLRESWRIQKNELSELAKSVSKYLAVFIIYNGKKMPLYQELFEQTGKAIIKLTGIIEKN